MGVDRGGGEGRVEAWEMETRMRDGTKVSSGRVTERDAKTRRTGQKGISLERLLGFLAQLRLISICCCRLGRECLDGFLSL